jgi:hypothetical protein
LDFQEILLQNKQSTEQETRRESEIYILRALCIGEHSPEQVAALVHALEPYRFVELEHQVIFESIRSIMGDNRLSASVLAVHLNNRGFPDLKLDPFFAGDAPDVNDALKRIRAICSQPR